MKILLSGMSAWYLMNTAKGFQERDVLAGCWFSNKNSIGIDTKYYKRVWPYHLSMKPFYHFAPASIEEPMRWWNLPLYDFWMKRQKLPEGTNVVQAPMGSCKSLFALANKSKNRILKVFDAPNSHPTTQRGYWQRELDLNAPHISLPVPNWVWARINREIYDADVVLCPSNFVRDTMVMNGVPENKCIINRFGVDVSIFKKRVCIPKNPIFVCTGSVCVRKGHQYLIPAFEKLRKFYPEARLILLGGVRPDFKQLWKNFSQFNGVENLFVSHEEMARILSQATAFVLPSVEEGFARALSEAMACGLPIIATHESGATTVVRNGKEGIIVPVAQVESLYEAMQLLSDDVPLNEQMGEASYKIGNQGNSWQDYSDRLISLYENLTD